MERVKTLMRLSPAQRLSGRLTTRASARGLDPDCPHLTFDAVRNTGLPTSISALRRGRLVRIAIGVLSSSFLTSGRVSGQQRLQMRDRTAPLLRRSTPSTTQRGWVVVLWEGHALPACVSLSGWNSRCALYPQICHRRLSPRPAPVEPQWGHRTATTSNTRPSFNGHAVRQWSQVKSDCAARWTGSLSHRNGSTTTG